jgi:hypothetical protein
MTAISQAVCHAIHQTLPACPPGFTAAAIRDLLIARGIDRALTSIKQALPRMRRGGYVNSQGIPGQHDFHWWRTDKVFHQPPAMWRGRSPKGSVARVASPPEPAFVDRRPHLYPMTATALRGLPSKPLVVRPSLHRALPTDADVVRVWASMQGLPFKNWTDLAAVNERRRALGKIEFARPAEPPTAFATKPMVRPSDTRVVAVPMTHPMVR